MISSTDEHGFDRLSVFIRVHLWFQNETPMDIDASTLLPHRPPMRMIDRLVDAGPGTACAEAVLGDGHFGVAGGRVLEAALVECVAQTAAAQKALGAGGAPAAPGLLAGVSAFRVFRRPAAGERLTIRTKDEKRLGPMSLVAGDVFVGGERVAAGQLKLFDAQTPPAAPGVAS
jgi:predicted hotdog family 3-hydroxylacyl-ACP dehydratase